jgi:transketolase
MGVVNLKTGEEKLLSRDELMEAAQKMRAYTLVAIHAAGSGHPGGSLSIMDITAALYLTVARHSPDDPEWPERDRIFWSTGHKAPVLYNALAITGYLPMEDTMKLRRLGSGFEGHPNRLKLPGIELSSGSLGQGLGVAVGDALAARTRGQGYRVYCIMGDGEQDEGSVWEAAMCAGHYGLDNLVGIVDRNRLQIDGWTKDVMDIEPLADKYRAFNWHVIEIDGHDMGQILDAFEKAKSLKGKPTAIIADTIKGKGVSFMENVAGWHGVATEKREQLDQALEDLRVPELLDRSRVDALLKIAEDYQREVDVRIEAEMPRFPSGGSYWWNARDDMKVEMDATRNGFGVAIARLGSDERVVAFGADITGSIRMDMFYKEFPERKPRFFSVGIAEQNMALVAAGLAKEGFIPFMGSYGVFATGRNWDQLRTTVAYNNYSVKIADAHGGISVGPDGATHQALEEISLTAVLPEFHVTVPADSAETAKCTEAIAGHDGPALVRYAREPTPVVTEESTPFEFGAANVIRFRGEQPRFIDAFETVLARDYRSENEDIAIIACGPMVPEAMRAAWILKQEYDLDTRVVNVHTVKPLDEEALVRAAEEVGVVITAEEHQVGGFGNLVASAIVRRKRFDRPLALDMVGVGDTFGESGQPWELMRAFGLTAEHIAQRAKALYDRSGVASVHRSRE